MFSAYSCAIKAFETAAALFALVVLTGCVAPIKYQTAVPQLPAGSSGQIHSDIIELNLPELTLYIQLQALDWDGQYLLPPLGLWMNIEPLSKPIAISTLGVKLTSDGKTAETVSYLGPDKHWFSPRALAAGCGPRFYRTGIGLSRFGASQESVINANNELGIIKPSERPISMDKEGCFMFWFDTDPLPNHTFLLDIDGISYQGKQISVPQIKFQKGTISEIRGFP
jgi:hypothetical protein